MIVESSALLAVLFGEERALTVVSALETSQTAPAMSIVNFIECRMTLHFKRTDERERAKAMKMLEAMPVEIVPINRNTIPDIAAARSQYRKLNFGDCFAYALAKERGEPLLTLDEDFQTTDIAVVDLNS